MIEFPGVSVALELHVRYPVTTNNMEYFTSQYLYLAKGLRYGYFLICVTPFWQEYGMQKMMNALHIINLLKLESTKYL